MATGYQRELQARIRAAYLAAHPERGEVEPKPVVDLLDETLRLLPGCRESVTDARP